MAQYHKMSEPMYYVTLRRFHTGLDNAIFRITYCGGSFHMVNDTKNSSSIGRDENGYEIRMGYGPNWTLEKVLSFIKNYHKYLFVYNHNRLNIHSEYHLSIYKSYIYNRTEDCGAMSKDDLKIHYEQDCIPISYKRVEIFEIIEHMRTCLQLIKEMTLNVRKEKYDLPKYTKKCCFDGKGGLINISYCKGYWKHFAIHNGEEKAIFESEELFWKYLKMNMYCTRNLYFEDEGYSDYYPSYGHNSEQIMIDAFEYLTGKDATPSKDSNEFIESKKTFYDEIINQSKIFESPECIILSRGRRGLHV